MKIIKPTKVQKALFAISLLYTIAFIILSIYSRNWEFFFYTMVMMVAIPLIWLLHLKYGFGTKVMVGLTLLGITNLLGGLWVINGMVLYDHYVFNLLKFDKIVHFFGIYIATLGLFAIVRRYVKQGYFSTMLLFTWFIGISFGALWEIIEFIPVMTMAKTGVGGYINNLGDLLADTFGATIAMIYIIFRKKYPRINIKLNGTNYKI